MSAGLDLVQEAGSNDEIYFWNLKIDPRLKGYPFVGQAWFPIVVCGTYLWFVYISGPRLMANRKAFTLRYPIMAHNAFMVLTNMFFFYKFLKNSYLANYSLFCQGMTYATDENSMEIVHWGFWYLLLRILDFLDTVFFVLRKKTDHVTFQHVSHHFCCVFSGHLWVSLGMDGQTLAGLCINSFVHICMYTYYFLAACGPRFKKYLWWKKYLTKMQIYQHIFLVLHGIVPIFYDCGYPKFFIYLGVPQGLLGLGLFLNFYVLAYSKKRSATAVDLKSCANAVADEIVEQKALLKAEELKKDE